MLYREDKRLMCGTNNPSGLRMASSLLLVLTILHSFMVQFGSYGHHTYFCIWNKAVVLHIQLRVHVSCTFKNSKQKPGAVASQRVILMLGLAHSYAAVFEFPLSAAERAKGSCPYSSPLARPSMKNIGQFLTGCQASAYVLNI